MTGENRKSAEKLRLAVIVAAGVFAIGMITGPVARAQTYTVIHAFGGADGANPYAGLTMDRAGNLYGTTEYGGRGYGTVFRMSYKNSSWILTTLYEFQNGSDGAFPEGRVTIGPDGSLYGTTNEGGTEECGGYPVGCGTIYRLQPPARACASAQCPWRETQLYIFDASNGTGFPAGDLVLDRQGNIYGSAGYAYELSPSNGGWTMSIISTDYPSYYGFIFDSAGNLYGAGYGNVFELSPSPDGWVPQVLYTLNNETQGSQLTGLVFDQAGNLYGGAADGGPGRSGTVFQLSPSNGGWTFNLLYAFSGTSASGPSNGSLVIDPAGNVYGATEGEFGQNGGSAFRLSPSNGGWTYTDLYDFQLASPTGCFPNNGMVRDAAGNLYGTTLSCGTGNPSNGVVFEITP
jgi:hypothetical protein